MGSIFASSGLDVPIGLAFDSAGNLYAANNNGPSIEVFTPSGAGSRLTYSGLGPLTFLAFTNDAGQPLPLANHGPEPATWAILLGGLGLLGGVQRFRRREGVNLRNPGR